MLAGATTTAPSEERRARRRAMVAARLAKLPRRIREQLDAEGAPGHVRLWVAWAHTAELRDTRLALALLLRRPSKVGRRWRWPTDAEKSAIGEVLWRWTPLQPEEIPGVAFEAAIARRLAARGRPLSFEAVATVGRATELEAELEALRTRMRKLVTRDEPHRPTV